jgi:hypothetical protein
LVTYTIPTTASCPAATASANVVITPVPSATGVVGNAAICSGPDVASASNANISLTSPQPGTTFNWSMYAGATPTGTAIESGSGSPINNPIANNT